MTDIDLTAQIAQHEATGATGTLALVPVPDPTNYGLVRLNEDNAVREFVEKPSADQIDTNLISAGAYVLERSIVDCGPQFQNVTRMLCASVAWEFPAIIFSPCGNGRTRASVCRR